MSIPVRLAVNPQYLRPTLAGLVLIALLLGMHPQPVAAAGTFVVTSALDAPDASPGDSVCATLEGTCTLRAAIQEANALPGFDTVNLPAGTYALDERVVIEDDLMLVGAGAKQTTIDGQHKSPLLGVRTDEWLVCDAAQDRVLRYDRNGDYLGVFAANDLDMPVDVFSRPGEDELLIVDAPGGVGRYDEATGKPLDLFVIPSLPNEKLVADAVLGNGAHANFDLYVANYVVDNQTTGSVQRYNSTTGALVGTFVAPGAGGLTNPSGLATHDGDLFVADTGSDAVLRYDGETGAAKGAFVAPGSGGLDQPRGLLFHEGSLYVSSGATDSVLRYSTEDGSFQGAFVAQGAGGLDQPTRLEMGHEGTLYVLSGKTQQILRYDGATGAFLDVFIQGGNAQLGMPGCMHRRDGFGDGPLVNISGVSLINGQTSLADAGAALKIDNGARVFVSNSSVRDNASSTIGGAITNYGTLSIRRSEVVGNTLPEGGGGVTSTGGGIFNAAAAKLTLSQSLLAHNIATRGGGLANQGQADLVNMTISGNRTWGAGGGVYNYVRGRLRVNFSTISGNRANESGGSGEERRWGGGIFNAEQATVALGNSILAGNDDGRSYIDMDYSPDCYNLSSTQWASHRDNIIGVVNGNCMLPNLSQDGKLVDMIGLAGQPFDPKLTALLDNGGLTRTYQPLLTSAALDNDVDQAADPFFRCPTRDQRVYPRPFDANGDGKGRCDIGAVERQPKPLAPFDDMKVAPGVVAPWGPTEVTISGANFTPGMQVRLGRVGVEQVRVVDARTLSIVTPAELRPGIYDLTIIAPGGAQATLAEALEVPAFRR